MVEMSKSFCTVDVANRVDDLSAVTNRATKFQCKQHQTSSPLVSQLQIANFHTPTNSYLELRSHTQPPAKLVILDLNGTLLSRAGMHQLPRLSHYRDVLCSYVHLCQQFADIYSMRKRAHGLEPCPTSRSHHGTSLFGE